MGEFKDKVEHVDYVDLNGLIVTHGETVRKNGVRLLGVNLISGTHPFYMVTLIELDHHAKEFHLLVVVQRNSIMDSKVVVYVHWTLHTVRE